MTQPKAKENKEKRVSKTEPKLLIELDERQKQVVEAFYEHDFVIVEGKWGSGKTMASVATAIKSHRKREFNKMTVTRPFIPDKGLGALPGEIESKLTFEMQPILDNYHECQGKEQTDKMLKDGTIKLQYNGKVKGLTVKSSIFLCDETQDLTYTQFLELLTRLGKDSKMICTISKEQIHSSIGKDSCYYKLRHLKDSGIVGWVELEANHRHSIINEIIDYIEQKEKEENNSK